MREPSARGCLISANDRPLRALCVDPPSCVSHARESLRRRLWGRRAALVPAWLLRRVSVADERIRTHRERGLGRTVYERAGWELRCGADGTRDWRDPRSDALSGTEGHSGRTTRPAMRAHVTFRMWPALVGHSPHHDLLVGIARLAV